jgi:SagB-type dehydrogenase family enzyme
MIHFPGDPISPPPQWPQEIRDRIHRVFDYHVSSKLAPRSIKSLDQLDPGQPPPMYRTFHGAEKVALPTNLMNADAPTLSLLVDTLHSVPESQLNPPHDLLTLATWLYFADGVLSKKDPSGKPIRRRALPSNGEAYPCEIWVAAFGVEGLPPGLYYYSPREFVLRQLRDGLGVLAHLKRGRPDLEFLRNVPATLLISTIFARSTWRFQKRGYRAALLDTGHLIENLVQVGTALGMQTSARLRINDAATRELIGVPKNVPFEHAEAVQGIVSWTNELPQPLVVPAAAQTPMPAIDRPSHSSILAYDTIVAAHEDCVAPGVAIREVRPPFTQLTPLDGNIPVMQRVPIELPSGGRDLAAIILNREPVHALARKSLARDPFLAINKLALQKVTYYPMVPEAPHVALVRPLWFIQDVSGFESGIWYYHPQIDRWSILARGSYRAEAAFLSGENKMAGDASAVCVLIANLHLLLQHVGPDSYRLAHLEAGAVAHRMQLVAEAQHLAAVPNGSFYDDDIRKFFGLEQSGWEAIYQVFVGEAFDEKQEGIRIIDPEVDAVDWRG